MVDYPVVHSMDSNFSYFKRKLSSIRSSRPQRLIFLRPLARLASFFRSPRLDFRSSRFSFINHRDTLILRRPPYSDDTQQVLSSLFDTSFLPSLLLLQSINICGVDTQVLFPLCVDSSFPVHYTLSRRHEAAEGNTAYTP
jgi:hypothetical protein